MMRPNPLRCPCSDPLASNPGSRSPLLEASKFRACGQTSFLSIFCFCRWKLPGTVSSKCLDRHHKKVSKPFEGSKATEASFDPAVKLQSRSAVRWLREFFMQLSCLLPLLEVDSGAQLLLAWSEALKQMAAAIRKRSADEEAAQLGSTQLHGP